MPQGQTLGHVRQGRAVIPVEWTEIEALGLGRLEGGGRAARITGIKADSREVGSGDLFVALNTGIEHVAAARARGAATLVPDDQESALAALATLVRSKSAARVVAVVGSAGKTSTKDILGALCAPHTPTIWAEKSLNNEIGLPLTVCGLEPETKVLITEMGMRGLGEIAALSTIARPDVAVISHIGPEHLELLGTVEKVAEANAEVIAALPAGGTAVVPATSPQLEPFLSRDDIELRRFDPADAELRERPRTLPGRRTERRARASVHPATPCRQHARRPPCLRSARASARARLRGRVSDPALPLARRGDRAAGRRVRRQRRLQRQSRLDAGSPRASRGTSGNAAARCRSR